MNFLFFLLLRDEYLYSYKLQNRPTDEFPGVLHEENSLISSILHKANSTFVKCQINVKNNVIKKKRHKSDIMLVIKEVYITL